MDKKLELLLFYIERGWPIFPLLPGDKIPAFIGGYKKATCNKYKIKQWHNFNPDYNWGLATGEVSGILVVDLDSKGDGLKGWERLIELHGMPEPTITVITGNGGKHFWFKYPTYGQYGRKIGWKPGIDILGNGGHVVIPPSKTNNIYRFVIGPDTVDLALPPTWLLERINKKKSKSLDPPIVRKGERNNWLTSRAGRYHAQGNDADWIVKVLKIDNEKYCNPPLSDQEVEKIAESIGRYKKGSPKKTKASRLVALAEDTGLELFRTPEGEPFARIPIGDHFEVWSVRSRGLSNWLSQLFYDTHGEAISRDTRISARSVLEGRAQFEGDVHPVYTRVGEYDGIVYLDLANDKWQAIAIDVEGWKIVDKPPVRFVRGAGMMPLIPPVSRGNLDDELHPLINIENNADWTLIVAWLVMTLNPHGPYPVLVLHGEQGSSKSTVSKILRSIIDPNEAPLRTKPRNERDLMITAQNSWVLTFDNISNLQDWLSDAICRLSTGGGFSTRGLYTDEEEKLFTAKRPIIMNGIEEIVTRSDLLDRSMILYLPTIEATERRSEVELMEEFTTRHGAILGALFDAISKAIAKLDEVRVSEIERMADFCVWVTTAEGALGWRSKKFLQAYHNNRQIIHMLALDSWPVAGILIDWINKQHENYWEGTATNLLRLLKKARLEKSLQE